MAAISNVIQVSDDTQFQEELNRAGSKLVVVDFFATWCGPCKYIAPFYVQLSLKYPQSTCTFLKVDVDECQVTAAIYGIRAMPTFCFLKNGKTIDEISGADPTKLEATIQRLITLEQKGIDDLVPDPALVTVGRGFGSFADNK